MVLVEYGSNGRGWSGWFAFMIGNIFFRSFKYLLGIYQFLSLSDKKLVIVSAAIPVSSSGK